MYISAFSLKPQKQGRLMSKVTKILHTLFATIKSKFTIKKKENIYFGVK